MEFLLGPITRRINVLYESRMKWTWHHSKLAVEEVSFFGGLRVVLLQLLSMYDGAVGVTNLGVTLLWVWHFIYKARCKVSLPLTGGGQRSLCMIRLQAISSHNTDAKAERAEWGSARPVHSPNLASARPPAAYSWYSLGRRTSAGSAWHCSASGWTPQSGSASPSWGCQNDTSVRFKRLYIYHKMRFSTLSWRKWDFDSCPPWWTGDVWTAPQLTQKYLIIHIYGQNKIFFWVV